MHQNLSQKVIDDINNYSSINQNEHDIELAKLVTNSLKLADLSRASRMLNNVFKSKDSSSASSMSNNHTRSNHEKIIN